VRYAGRAAAYHAATAEEQFFTVPSSLLSGTTQRTSCGIPTNLRWISVVNRGTGTDALARTGKRRTHPNVICYPKPDRHVVCVQLHGDVLESIRLAIKLLTMQATCPEVRVLLGQGDIYEQIMRL